jgi:hypothetical protein
MSTAIAVMNKRGVALASDSAYTFNLWDNDLEITHIFPHLISFVADGLIAGRLRYTITARESMSRGNTAHVVPFGTDEMIQTFLDRANQNAIAYRVKSEGSSDENGKVVTGTV